MWKNFTISKFTQLFPILCRFEKESDQLTEPTRAKEEEEKILIARYAKILKKIMYLV